MWDLLMDPIMNQHRWNIKHGTGFGLDARIQMLWAGELCPIVHLARLWDKEENEKERDEDEFEKRECVSQYLTKNHSFLYIFFHLTLN